MRRLFTMLVAVLACLLGLPAAATAAPAPLGSGSVLFNPLGPVNVRCTAAFAATDGRSGYLVAGPGCRGGTLYSGNGVLVGEVVPDPARYAGFVVVRVTNTVDWTLVPWVDAGGRRVVLTGSRETPIGGRACLAGPAVGLNCGTVVAKDQTHTFPWGETSGLTRTNVCVDPRNFGGAFITDDQAQGVPLGGSTFCSTVGNSYFQPINKILSAFRLKLLTG